MRERVAWSAGTWSTAPVAAVERDDGLVVEAAAESDFWERTGYGFSHRNGHALLAPWSSDVAVEVTFRLEGFTELYDQAGLMLFGGDEQWIKASVEFNDGVASLGAVVTLGRSDWSLAAVPEWVGREVTIRASRLGDGVLLRARARGDSWRTIRLAPVPDGDLRAGPMLCAPTRAGFGVRFTEWAWASPDVDLHEDPPS
jgi:regulation of enolase protein 1 (concanavalin A-like superfamily)